MPTEEYLQEHLDRGTDRLGLQVYPEPEGVTDAPVVVVWPAMGVRARYYRWTGRRRGPVRLDRSPGNGVGDGVSRP